MKAIKIDIKREELEIPRVEPYCQYNREIPTAAQMVEEGAYPTDISITQHETTYYPRKVFMPNKEEEIWLVQQDDNEVLEGLFSIYNTDVDGLVYKAEKRGHEEGYQEGRYDGKKYIRSRIENMSFLQMVKLIFTRKV